MTFTFGNPQVVGDRQRNALLQSCETYWQWRHV